MNRLFKSNRMKLIMGLKKEVGNRLKEWRLKKGLTQ